MAGTVTTTEVTYQNVKKITFSWTSSAGGAADATTTGVYTGTLSGYTIPGAGGSAPSAAYDLRLLDSAGVDVLNAQGANRSETATEYIDDSTTGKVVGSSLTLEITNAGNAKSGTVIIFVSPVGMVMADTDSAATYATAPRIATATSSSPLTSGALWTYTGTIEVLALVGRITTAIQAQATSVKITVTADALAAVNVTTDGLDLNAFVVGTLIGHAGHGNAMNGTDGHPEVENGHECVFTCVTSGTIGVVYGAASTGAIAWTMLWRPLSANATVS